jgi:Zn-dependent oligopeptidase
MQRRKRGLSRLDQELSVLSPNFSRNVLNATNAFTHFVEKEEELDGFT